MPKKSEKNDSKINWTFLQCYKRMASKMFCGKGKDMDVVVVAVVAVVVGGGSVVAVVVVFLIVVIVLVVEMRGNIKKHS